MNRIWMYQVPLGIDALLFDINKQTHFITEQIPHITFSNIPQWVIFFQFYIISNLVLNYKGICFCIYYCLQKINISLLDLVN